MCKGRGKRGMRVIVKEWRVCWVWKEKEVEGMNGRYWVEVRGNGDVVRKGVGNV